MLPVVYTWLMVAPLQASWSGQPRLLPVTV